MRIDVLVKNLFSLTDVTAIRFSHRPTSRYRMCTQWRILQDWRNKEEWLSREYHATCTTIYKRSNFFIFAAILYDVPLYCLGVTSPETNNKSHKGFCISPTILKQGLYIFLKTYSSKQKWSILIAVHWFYLSKRFIICSYQATQLYINRTCVSTPQSSSSYMTTS